MEKVKFKAQTDLRIDYPGHSCLPNDQYSSLIVKKKRRMERVKVPEEWNKLILKARKKPSPFEVVNLIQESFFNIKCASQKYFFKLAKPSIKIKKIKQLQIEAGVPTIGVRDSYNGYWRSSIIRNKVKLPTEMSLKTRQRRIPLEKEIMFTILVFAKPESFQAAGDRFDFASSIAHEVFREIIGSLIALMNQYIVWSENQNEVIRIYRERSHGFPGVVGAIDGCHISIKQPINNGKDYYNRKQVHSIILQ
ncbi:hypothetical protein ILUMI_20244, partial [Ignelater luminosus]